jgi:adenylosuccinate synthase
MIMAIATMYPPDSRDGIGFIDVPGTNYCVYISGASPILYYVITTPDGSKKCVIGTIMTPGYEIPDLATRIVWQQCRGIYGTGRWDTMRKHLLTATKSYMTCAEFVKNVSDELNKYIGYVSTASEMNPTTQSQSEIMGELTRLFYMENPEHATNHMREIIKLMDQLNMAVLSNL